ncbi:MAG: glycoside hydrolase family 27 protein [Phycisphaeraceae bacterium]|nr:glycoside hydrolase family 27 protein [Phycisphaeraceae bacterium]
MLAPTPPMGWNSWNTFGPDINEEVVRTTADAMVESGLKDAGYEYVCIDDLWEADERVDGKLTWDEEKFPGGMPALADYIHDLGLKFGIYSCSGTHTCAGKPASFGYEEIDAKTFAEWGVDFLKYDHCYFPPGADARAAYARMGQALRMSGRDIIYSLCNWGGNDVWTWGAAVGGHMWRNTGDITDSWERIVHLGFKKQKEMSPWGRPNGWNDPDMLVVGMRNRGNVAADGCTDDEYRSHFALWCMQAAPLMIGCDVREMDDVTKEILLNEDLIAVNQDPMGVSAMYLGRHRRCETWMKPLADGDIAVGFFCLHDDSPQEKVPIAREQIHLHDRTPCRIKDLWTGEDLGVHTRSFNSHGLEPHSCQVVRISPQPE